MFEEVMFFKIYIYIFHMLIIILDLYTKIKKLFNFVYFYTKTSLFIHLIIFQPIKSKLENTKSHAIYKVNKFALKF